MVDIKTTRIFYFCQSNKYINEYSIYENMYRVRGPIDIIPLNPLLFELSR